MTAKLPTYNVVMAIILSILVVKAECGVMIVNESISSSLERAHRQSFPQLKATVGMREKAWSTLRKWTGKRTTAMKNKTITIFFVNRGLAESVIADSYIASLKNSSPLRSAIEKLQPADFGCAVDVSRDKTVCVYRKTESIILLS